MKVRSLILLIGVILGSAHFLSSAVGPPTHFDTPLLQKHLPLPRDPDNPQSKPLLSCYYYPHFMVKQIDLGEEGAEQLSILHISKGEEQPPCRRTNAKDEMVIDSKAWDGYFEGVKGSFVFFNAADGVNGGVGFAIFSGSDGSKIFEDVAKSGMSSIELIPPIAQSDPNNHSDAAIKVRFRRVYQAPCSLRTDERNCWTSIKQITGLSDSAPPNCSAWYEAEEKRLPDGSKEVATDPSVITYEVEILLDSRNTLVRAAPISKPIECYGAD
ncbi:MAG: hypothetical protein WBQ94_23175 [Terracidiphilus sp.]